MARRELCPSSKMFLRVGAFFFYATGGGSLQETGKGDERRPIIAKHWLRVLRVVRLKVAGYIGCGRHVCDDVV